MDSVHSSIRFARLLVINQNKEIVRSLTNTTDEESIQEEEEPILKEAYSGLIA